MASVPAKYNIQPRIAAASAEAMEKRKKALALRTLGASYDDIAAKTGIRRSFVGSEIKKALEAIPMLEVTEYRKMQSERLDRLLGAFWQRALAGDVKAAAVILRIEERRSLLLGLDVGRKVSEDGPRVGELARALPPGAKATIEASSLMQNPDVIAAVQKARREKMLDAGAIETTATAVPEDEDERLYAEAVAQAAATA